MQHWNTDDRTVRNRDGRAPVRSGDAEPVSAPAGQLERPAEPSAPDGNGAASGRTGGAYWNIKLPTGQILAKWFPERPSHKNGLLKDGQVLVTKSADGYRSRAVAITRERSDQWYPHLLRQAMKRGYNDSWGKHATPTLNEIADWTGLSLHSLRAWMKPNTAKSHRPMPRHAIRLILHEFWLRDNSKYDWSTVLRHCQ